MVESCCAPFCKNKRNSSTHKSYFKFPLCDPYLTKLWVAALNKENWLPSKYSTLCSDHFSAEYLYHKRDDLHSLKKGALPTIFNIPTGLQKRPYVRKKPYAERKKHVINPFCHDINFATKSILCLETKFSYESGGTGSSDESTGINLSTLSSEKVRNLDFSEDDSDEDSVRGLDDSVYVKYINNETKIPPPIDGNDIIIFPEEGLMLLKQEGNYSDSEEMSDIAEVILKDSLKSSNGNTSTLKVFKCIQCNVTYDTVLKLQVHVNVFHSSFSKSIFCFIPNCTAVFDCEDKLKQHISLKHKISKYKNCLKCNDCYFLSSSHLEMKKHIIEHIKFKKLKEQNDAILSNSNF